ncbi:MAG: hypothetical protein ACI3YJ_11035 [Prevotella sp.]
MMKRTGKLWMQMAIVLCCLAFATSCSDDDVANDDNGVVIPDFTQKSTMDISEIEVGEIDSVSWHEHYSTILGEAEQGNSEEDQMLAAFARRGLEKNDSLIDAYLDQSGGNTEWGEGWDGTTGKNRLLGYKYVTIRYPSVDATGQRIMLSELVIFPYNSILPNPNPDNLVIGCHVTITSNKERPSNYNENSFSTDVGMLACHASSESASVEKEALVVIPDYEGYGATHENPHPYLYQSLTARQVVDGAEAAVLWFEEKQKSMDSGWKAYSVGYSQGGSVAMAVHKHIEQSTNSTLKSRFIGSICGDGPYSPMATIKDYIATKKIYMPVALGLILKGMCDVNPYMKGKYQMEDFLTPGFMASGIKQWITDKNYTTDDTQAEFREYSLRSSDFTVMAKTAEGGYLPYKEANMTYEKNGVKVSREWSEAADPMCSYCEIEEVLRPEVIEFFATGSTTSEYIPKCMALKSALEMNDLTVGWMPSHPIIMFHSTRDEVVPFSNYESAMKGFKGTDNVKGIRYASNTYTHVGTGRSFYAWYERSYASDLLKGKWKNYANESEQTGIIVW